jgi:hypothetical protein
MIPSPKHEHKGSYTVIIDTYRLAEVGYPGIAWSAARLPHQSTETKTQSIAIKADRIGNNDEKARTLSRML